MLKRYVVTRDSWNSVKPLFSGKIARRDKIILIEKDEKTEAEKIVEMTRWLQKF